MMDDDVAALVVDNGSGKLNRKKYWQRNTVVPRDYTVAV